MKVIVIGMPDPVACQAALLMAVAGHQVTAVLSGGQRPCPQVARMARIVAPGDTPALTGTCRGHDAVCDLGTVPDTPASTCLYLMRARARRRRQRQAAAARAAIAAGGVRRLILRSAASVYADGGHAWLDETSPVMPSPLIRSCLDAEAAAVGHACHGGDAVVLRLGAVYGPDDPVTRAMIRTARRGWRPFAGPPDAYRPTLSSQDAAAAVVRALYVPPGTYNVTDTRPPTVEELNDILAGAVGTRLHPLWPAFRRADEEYVARSQRVSAAAYHAAAGWTASTSALQVLVHTARGAGARLSTVTPPGVHRCGKGDVMDEGRARYRAVPRRAEGDWQTLSTGPEPGRAYATRRTGQWKSSVRRTPPASAFRNVISTGQSSQGAENAASDEPCQYQRGLGRGPVRVGAAALR